MNDPSGCIVIEYIYSSAVSFSLFTEKKVLVFVNILTQIDEFPCMNAKKRLEQWNYLYCIGKQQQKKIRRKKKKKNRQKPNRTRNSLVVLLGS